LARYLQWTFPRKGRQGGGSVKAAIDRDRCDRRTTCGVIRVCPKGAVKAIPGGVRGKMSYVVDETMCAGCGICVRACPMGAVRMD
jgi:NAD-dependent dihydropyrimidine dehydrogenase PreA subunit